METVAKIIQFLSDLVSVIKEAVSMWNRAKREGWISDLEVVTRAIKEAKTDEDRRLLAQRLALLIRSSP